jgi:hypothetical protein
MVRSRELVGEAWPEIGHGDDQERRIDEMAKLARQTAAEDGRKTIGQGTLGGRRGGGRAQGLFSNGAGMAGKVVIKGLYGAGWQLPIIP